MRGTGNSYIVTGAAGFIGSHLSIALLNRGCHVVGIDNFDPLYDRSIKEQNVQRIEEASGANRTASFRFVEADIRNAVAMQKICDDVRPTALFQLAALCGVRESLRDPARYAAVNVDGLVNMLEAARNSGCRNFIFASSSSVYGNTTRVPFSEDDPACEPISPYAATKRAGELICQTYAHAFNMRIASLRFFTVYGPAQRPDLAIAKFMRLIEAGEPVPMFGDGSTSRDYTFIDDVIGGVLAAHHVVTQHAAHEQSFFRIWNLGNSQPISLRELIDRISLIVGKPSQIEQLPMQPGDVQRTWADVCRSANELMYQPSVALEEGLWRQWTARSNNRQITTAVADVPLVLLPK